MSECVGCACMPAMMGSREHGKISSGNKVLQNLKSEVLQSKKKSAWGVRSFACDDGCDASGAPNALLPAAR